MRAEMPAAREKLDRLLAQRTSRAVEARAKMIDDELGSLRAALAEHDNPALIAALEAVPSRRRISSSRPSG
jgi:hypothetical protein